jgi:ankyrin repeat protein
LACQIDDVELVEVLAGRAKANLDYTPFVSTAVSFGCKSVVIWLLKSQKPIDFTALSGPLVTAGRFGCIPIVRMIFDQFPVERQREIAAQSIEKAIEEQNLDLVDLFSSLGVSGENLCLAAEKSSLEIVKKLVSRGDSPDIVNARNSEQSTPLTLATQHSKDDIALFLLNCPGIDPSIHDRQHMTPLVCAALHGRVLVAKAIIEHYGTAVRERIPEVNRALRKGMRFPGQEVGLQVIPDRPVLIQSKVAIMLTFLAVPGVEVNPIAKGETLFQFAAKIGSVELIEELMKFPQIDVNDFSESGTPLMISLEAGSDPVSLMLIECDRVDLNYSQNRKETSLQAAIQGSNLRILKFLIASPRFDPKRHDIVTALNLAILRQKLEICQTLVELPLFQIDGILSLFTTLMLYGNDQLIDFFLHRMDVRSLKILHNACVLDHMRITEFVLRQFDDDVNLVIETWLPQTRQLQQLRQQQISIQQQIVNAQQQQVWSQLPAQQFQARQLQYSLQQQQSSVLQQQLAILIPSPNATVSRESLLAISVLSGSSGVSDHLINHSHLNLTGANAMAVLKRAVQHPDVYFGLQNESLRIALRLPRVDVNGFFDDGTTPLTALFGAKMANAGQYQRTDGWNQPRMQAIVLSMDLLLAVKEIDVNQPDRQGRRLLIEFLKLGPHVPLSLVGRNELDWNVRDEETLDTPLILVAKSRNGMNAPFDGNDPLLTLMLRKREIDVNAQNRDGNTALIEAVKANSSAEFAAIATRDDCRLGIANNAGETVFSLTGCCLPSDATRSDIVNEISSILLETSEGFGTAAFTPPFIPMDEGEGQGMFL